MALLGDLVVRIVGDTADFVRSVDQSGRRLNQFEKDLKKITATMSKVGKQMTMFVTLPIVGIGAAFVKAAADAEEVNNKFDTVFKDQAAGVRDWAAQFGQATGRATVDNLKFLASVQDLFVPLGLARDEAAELAKSVVTLATDVGSFNNLPTADVMRDIQSALVGNHETVRKYGVILSEVTVNQELLNMGIKGGYKEATAAEKAIARYNLIVAGTADAQGDAVRTAGSFTNQFRALQASAKDLAEGFGKLLLPAMTKIVQGLKDALQWINALDEDTKRTILTIMGIAAAIGPLLLIGAKLITFLDSFKRAMASLNLTMNANPILAIVTAVALLGTAVYLLIKNWEKVAPFFAKVWNKMIDIFEFAYGPIIAVMLDIINFAKEHLLNGFIKVAEGVGKAIDWIAAKFGKETGAFESITTWIDKWTVPAHERLTFSFDRLRVAVDNTSDSMKTNTEELEKLGKQAEETGEDEETLAEQIDRVNKVTGDQIAVLALLGTSLQKGWDEEKAIYAERAAEIADEVARKKAAWDEGAAIRRAWEETQAQMDEAAKAEAEKRELDHQMVLQKLRLATEAFTRTLISSLASIWDSYYQGLLQNEELTDDERKKIMRNQAIAQKTFGIFQAIIDTALAINKALSSVPPPASWILAGISAAAGALQIATIAAQPLPQLAEGGITPAILHPNEAVIPLDSSEAMRTLTEAVETANSGGTEGGQPVHVVVNLGAKTLYDDISKATRDRRILIDAGAVA